MHLKRVEMENFKSFGRKVTIPFLEGFTAITGPNGSGKSNIADGILFVLGPRSSKVIRAGRLTDLIFNGGKGKKAADACRVALTFDNKDRTIPVEEDEITLTRVVRKSKTNKDDYYSHYYVNGRASKQGEIENLLAHARISADGYNIVQQGDVTRMVTMTPLERRRQLDDIAGITRFDEEIERADKKRAEVEANLERIGIILGEIGHQLKALDRDRDAATKYRDLKEEHEKVRASIAWRRANNAREELARITDSFTKTTADRAKSEAELEALKGRSQDAEAKLRDAEQRMAALGGEEARQLREKVEALRLATQLAKEAMNHAKSEIQDLKEAKGRSQAELRTVQQEQKRLGKEQEALAKQREKACEGLEAKNADLAAVRESVSASNSTSGDLNRQLAQMKLEHEKLSARLHEAGLEHDRLGERRERLRAALAEAEEAVKAISFELKDVGFHIQEMEKERSSLGTDADSLRKEHLAKKKEESDLTKQLGELEPAIRRLRNDYSQLKAESDAAQNVQRGYTRAVDAVLEARDTGKLRGICGTIAELGKVDRKLETAMGIAAGGRMQAIVTEDDDSAAQAIEFLKKHKLGRATFLPLNKMVPGRPSGKPLMCVKDPDANGFALDLVKFDERFRHAFWYVFRDTIIVKNMDAARRLMGGVRLVTLDGGLIDAGGAMTGGLEAHASLTFGAASTDNLDRLGKQLRAAVEHQEVLSAQLLELREGIAALEEKLRGAGFAKEGSVTKLEDLQRRRKEFEAKLKVQQEVEEQATKDLAGVDKALEKHGGELAEVKARLKELDAERDGKGKLLLKTTSKELAEKLESLQMATLELAEQVRDAEAKLGAVTKQQELVAARATELETRLTEADQSIAAHAATIEAKKAEAEKGEEELRVLLKVEESKSGELKGLQQARDKAYEERVALQAEMEKLADRIDSLGDLLVGLEAKQPALEQEAQDAEAELAACTFKVEGEVAEPLDQLRSKLRGLERSIEGLGNVNFRALDEYEAQSKRKAELEGEVERLNLQREELLKLVEEVTLKKTEGLMKVFTEINTNFQDMFSKLSDGGIAELRLENPQRPFEGGLIIRAQPRGKKVSRLEALSGGEKSLTALAFIFAIQEYAPSPFYVLDEVDMFLDGVNAEKVALLVKANSQRAQFVMVSLRKVTLKEADHVYGVTMQSEGVTDVVGKVNLEEVVEPPAPQEPEVPVAVTPP